MAVNKVDYRATRIEDTSRYPSPQIWGDCPLLDVQEDPARGVIVEDNFIQTALLATPTITTEAYYNNGWKAFGSAGGTLLSAFIQGGGGVILTETDDNQGVNMATLALPFKISRALGDFWFEVRLKVNNITDNDTGLFVGLIEQQTLSATVPIAAAGTLADANFVGWHRLESDGDQFNSVYKANGVTQVTIKDNAIGDCPTTAALVADTYIKLGMKYEKSGPYGAFQFSWFVNGFRLPDRYTMASADGTDFPNDVLMGLCIAELCGSNNDSITTVDWIKAAQLFV